MQRGSAAAPVKVLAILVSDKVVVLLRLLVDVVPWISLDVGVDDGHNLPPMRRHILLQLHRVWEEALVPGEVPAHPSKAATSIGHREAGFIQCSYEKYSNSNAESSDTAEHEVGLINSLHGAPLPVGVLNVQPDDIIGDVICIKAGVHLAHIRLIPVVPAALVVPQCKILGQRSGAGDLGVLL